MTHYDSHANIVKDLIILHIEAFFEPNATLSKKVIRYGAFRQYQGELNSILYENPGDDALRETCRLLWEIEWAMEDEIIL